MTNKKELNNEQLEKVAGGWDKVYDTYKPAFPTEITDYDELRRYIDQFILLKCKNSGMQLWAVGELKRYYDEPSGCGRVKVCDVAVKDSNTTAKDGVMNKFYLSDYYVYCQYGMK